MIARILMASLVALIAAGSASAVTLSVVQVGGTGVASSAQVGDTIVVSLVVTLDEGDVFTGVGGALEWDLEGNDVLDIVSASETGSLVLDGKLFSSINGLYRIGVPGTTGSAVDDGQSFPETFAGPTFGWGWELVAPVGDLDGIAGPRTFSIGQAEFVIRAPGVTTLSYRTESPCESVVGGQGWVINGQVVYENLELGTVVQLSSLSIRAGAPAAVPALGPLGLLLAAVGLAGAGIASCGRLRTRRSD